jgi:murein DD-endopeptidase MepM/ murein hydrolase activator NlpD
MNLRLDRKNRMRGILLVAILLPIAAWAQIQSHIVRRGDTLYSLGRQYGMSVQEIQEMNNLSDIHLSIGQVLKVKDAAPSERSAPETIQPGSDQPIQRSSLPATYFYQIQRGDNLYRIARSHGISVRDIVAWNDFANENAAIFPGQRIIVRNPASVSEEDISTAAAQAPATDQSSTQAQAEIRETIYVVKPKDTLYGIARANNISVAELRRMNSLSSDAIRVGQRLVISSAPRPVDQETLDRLAHEELLRQDRIRDDLANPVEGTVISEYGLRNGRPHKGIDIGAKNGTPIYAVLDGKVVFAGTQGAYGNVIVIEHPEFVMTVYAHNEKNLVAVGDKVTKGQQIATVGSTGNAIGSHLHFEYRVKGKAINPRKVLPLD